MNKRKKSARNRRRIQLEEEAKYRVLLPLSTQEEAGIMLPLAEAIVRARQGLLVILHVETVPEGHPLTEATARASRTRQALNSLLSEYGLDSAQVKTVVRVAHEIWDGIWETVDQEAVDLLLTCVPSSVLPEVAVLDLAHPRLANPPCAVVTLRPGTDLGNPPIWQDVERILVPFDRGPNTGLVLRIAQVLAETAQAEITLFHATDRSAPESEQDWLPGIDPAWRGLDRVTRSVAAKGDIPGAILSESKTHQVVIMGATTQNLASGGWHSKLHEQVSAEIGPVMMIIRDQAEAIPALVRSQGRIPRRDRPIAVVVDKWFAENTFHSREFAHLEQLVTLKEDQGLTISLGLPALNEEETVGNVIQTVRTALMDEVPLLDEMVLIDSGSVDYTREIAADLGIPVYIHHDILPQHGGLVGKGEALWKSLHVLNGDIIAWIDTDIKNIHPRFVFGVLGPLLREPRIHYSKGFYRRPLIRGDRLVAGGGGRVTELTARPFINLFYPELSGIIQPLSGEYAGRRQTLEQLPFFTGYGVETGLLIDILNRFGLQSIAQVDLLQRIHRNQKLHSLSKMSFAIMQVVISRLEHRKAVQLMDEENQTMNLIRYGPTRFFMEVVEVHEHERPPMIEISEYRERRGLDPLSEPPDDSLRIGVEPS